MNWDAIAAVGETIGAVGVIISLVYLARQISANTKSTAVSATSAYLQGFGQLNLPIMQSREFAETFVRGYFSYEELEDTERFQFQVAMAQWFYLWDSMYTLHQEGLLPAARWTAIRTMIINSLALPGVRVVWEELGRNIVNSELVLEVDSWPAPAESLFEETVRVPRVQSGLTEEADTD